MPLIQSSLTFLKVFKEGKLGESLPIKLKRTGHTNYAVKPNSGILILASVASVPERRVFPYSVRESNSSTK